MAHKKRNRSNPLSVIALFTAMVEASALASLPFLDDNSQTIYIWFLVGFPTFLAALFFATLNFNYKALYSPSDFETSADFLKGMESDAEGHELIDSQLLKFRGYELHIINVATTAPLLMISNQVEQLVATRARRPSSVPVLVLLVGSRTPPHFDEALIKRLAEQGCRVATARVDAENWHLRVI